MSQYIEYKDRDDPGQKFYRCDICGKIGLGSIVTISTWDGEVRLTKIDYCDECYAKYCHDKLITQDYREASGHREMGD